MRIVSSIMLILLLSCVAVQYNDPDPVRWMLIYGYGALVTGMAIAKRYTVLAPIGAILYLAGFIYWIPGATVADPSHIFTDLQMHEKGVEEVREAVGLLLCAVWMTVLSVVWLRNRRTTLTG